MAKMSKKKKEQRRKKLRSLILLLFLTVIMLSTATYAWFTANRSVQIDPINVHIAASSGLQISVDAEAWKTIISNDDIKTPGSYTTNTTYNKNQLPTELSPVSTAGSVSGGYLAFYKGVVAGITEGANAGQMGLTASATPAEAYGLTGDFIAFDIFLKVDDATADIYLENGSGVTVTSEQADKGLQYAARYAFVIEGHADSDDTVANMQKLLGGTTATIVEPNFDAHKSSGTINASQNYNITTTTAASGVAAVDYVGVKAAIADPIVLVNTNPGGTPSPTYFGSIGDLRKTNVAYSNAESGRVGYTGSTQAAHLLKIFTLSSGVTKVRVYMWIEGQDVDCENSASGAYLTYKLGLTLDDEE